MCKFGMGCKNLLCQFRHSENIDNLDLKNKQKKLDADKNLEKGFFINNMEDMDESESEEEEDLQCDDCGQVLDNFNAYTEHRGVGECAHSCSTCGKAFVDEDDYKTHIEKHCDNCCEEFSSKKVKEVHSRNCNFLT